MSTLRWSGAVATAALRAHLGGRLIDAMNVPRDEMEHALGTQGPPRSAPGSPPHIDTRELLDSLFVDADPNALVGRVGSDSDHAVYTERGTDTMDPRPWFNPSILVSINRMARELAR